MFAFLSIAPTGQGDSRPAGTCSRPRVRLNSIALRVGRALFSRCTRPEHGALEFAFVAPDLKRVVDGAHDRFPAALASATRRVHKAATRRSRTARPFQRPSLNASSASAGMHCAQYLTPPFVTSPTA